MKYIVEIKQKPLRSSPDSAFYTPDALSLTANVMTLVSKHIEAKQQGGISCIFQRGDGYKIASISKGIAGVKVYLDDLFKNINIAKLLLVNEAIIDLQGIDNLDKTIIIWEKCTCHTSPVYQCTLRATN